MDRKALASLVVVQVLFGLLPVAGKVAFQHFAPLSVGALRVFVGGLLLMGISAFVAKRTVDLRRDGRTVALLALLGVVVNQAFFVVGLSFTTAINATLIITSIPVFTYAIAVMKGDESWGPRRALGMLLALAGVLYLIGLSGYAIGLRNALGDALVLLNCLSFSAYLVLSKPIASRVNPLNLTAWQFLMASMLMVPLGVAVGLPQQAVTASGSAWLVVAFIVLGPTVITYTLNATALRTVSSSTVAVFIYLQPVVATISAWYWLGEELSWRLVPAALLVFVGVGIVAWRSKAAAAAVPQD